MKHTLAIAVLTTCLSSLPALAADFHVAPTGDDTNPGTKEKPFATLERARDAARLEKKTTIVLAPGTYQMTRTFALDERDSGTTYTGVDARITGGIDVPADAVQPVTDAAILDRIITEAARPHLRRIDLKKLGVTDYGEVGPRGFRRAYVPAPLELFINEQPCHIARWPNLGEENIKMGKVLDRGSNPRRGDYRMRPGIFEYENPRVAQWTQAEDLYISGFFCASYADDTIPVAEIDTKAGTITSKLPHLYGFKNEVFSTWHGLNLLEEIDAPGEYYVDRRSGMLYFYPPKDVDLASARIQISLLPDVLVAVEGASNVRIENLIFENSRGSGIYIERGTSNVVSHCTFRNLGVLAVQLGQGTEPFPEGQHNGEGHIAGRKQGVPAPRIMGSWHDHIYKHTAWNRQAGTANGLEGCLIHNMGAGGVSLGGGDRKTLTPAGNFVRNCDIHHVNRLDLTYKACINVDGVGNIIEHNRLHDTAAQAIYLHGNDHRIEYNEIFGVVRDMADAGAFYMGRDSSECGTMIRHNFFHDIYNHHSGRGGVQAIYFDDRASYGASVIGNVFYKAGSNYTIKFYGGGGVPIINNIFVDCPHAPSTNNHRSGEVVGQMKTWLGTHRLFKEVDISKPPYSTRYPQLHDLYTGKIKLETPKERNYIVKGDYSQFVDAQNLNFALKPGADIGIPGFEPIPFDDIGPKVRPGPQRK